MMVCIESIRFLRSLIRVCSNFKMVKITEAELRRICEGIRADREKIVQQNPIGTREETLLWMLLGVLISYLNLEANETPCFAGVSDDTTYRKAIHFVLNDRKASDFDSEPIIERMLAK